MNVRARPLMLANRALLRRSRNRKAGRRKSAKAKSVPKNSSEPIHKDARDEVGKVFGECQESPPFGLSRRRRRRRDCRAKPHEGTAQESALGILHRGRDGGRSQLRLAAITGEN